MSTPRDMAASSQSASGRMEAQGSVGGPDDAVMARTIQDHAQALFNLLAYGSPSVLSRFPDGMVDLMISELSAFTVQAQNVRLDIEREREQT